jgi:hypothetical protein
MYDNGMSPQVASARRVPTVTEAGGRISTTTPLLSRRLSGKGWVSCRNSLWQKGLRPSKAQLTQVIGFQLVTAANPGLSG